MTKFLPILPRYFSFSLKRPSWGFINRFHLLMTAYNWISNKRYSLDHRVIRKLLQLRLATWLKCYPRLWKEFQQLTQENLDRHRLRSVGISCSGLEWCFFCLLGENMIGMQRERGRGSLNGTCTVLEAIPVQPRWVMNLHDANSMAQICESIGNRYKSIMQENRSFSLKLEIRLIEPKFLPILMSFLWVSAWLWKSCFW